MKLTLSKIDELLLSLTVISKDYKVLNIILEAMNDWPNEIDSFDDYILEVESTISGKAIKENMEIYASNFTQYKSAWKMESISIILEVFDHFKNSKSLTDVLKYFLLRQS